MDTDALIAAVFSRTPIWDKQNKQHANRNTIDKLWKDIANEMQHESNKNVGFYSFRTRSTSCAGMCSSMK